MKSLETRQVISLVHSERCRLKSERLPRGRVIRPSTMKVFAATLLALNISSVYSASLFRSALGYGKGDTVASTASCGDLSDANVEHCYTQLVADFSKDKVWFSPWEFFINITDDPKLFKEQIKKIAAFTNELFRFYHYTCNAHLDTVKAKVITGMQEHLDYIDRERNSIARMLKSDDLEDDVVPVLKSYDSSLEVQQRALLYEIREYYPRWHFLHGWKTHTVHNDYEPSDGLDQLSSNESQGGADYSLLEDEAVKEESETDNLSDNGGTDRLSEDGETDRLSDDGGSDSLSEESDLASLFREIEPVIAAEEDSVPTLPEEDPVPTLPEEDSVPTLSKEVRLEGSDANEPVKPVTTSDEVRNAENAKTTSTAVSEEKKPQAPRAPKIAPSEKPGSKNEQRPRVNVSERPRMKPSAKSRTPVNASRNRPPRQQLDRSGNDVDIPYCTNRVRDQIREKRASRALELQQANAKIKEGNKTLKRVIESKKSASKKTDK